MYVGEHAIKFSILCSLGINKLVECVLDIPPRWSYIWPGVRWCLHMSLHVRWCLEVWWMMGNLRIRIRGCVQLPIIKTRMRFPGRVISVPMRSTEITLETSYTTYLFLKHHLVSGYRWTFLC